METSGAMNFKPRMTRIYTDKTEAQGAAWASQAVLPNQTRWQASLPTRLFLNRYSLRELSVVELLIL
jgi:hypothetical protein